MALYSIGQHVLRDEEAKGGATVKSIQLPSEDDPSGEVSYLVTYDEGGEGWWPESALLLEGGT